MATPTFDQIRREALAQYHSDKLREMGPDFAGTAPEDRELREGGYFREAQRRLMKERGGEASPRRRTTVKSVSAQPNEATARNVLGVEPREKAEADRIRELARGGNPRERFGSAIQPIVPVGRYPVPGIRRSEATIARPSPTGPTPKDATARAIEAQRTVIYSDQTLAANRRRGETLEDTMRRLQAARAPSQPPSARPLRRSVPPATEATVAPRRPGRRAVQTTPMKYLGRGRPRQGRTATRTAGLETTLERVPEEYHGLYGRAGTFVIYSEPGQSGRKFYRVKFQGRTFAPAFDTDEQARSFINDMKARAEPEFAARRERLVDADRHYFTETVIAHRQHPLFVRTIDRTKPPPARLVS